MSIREALPYMPLRPYTDKEWETLPHVVLTSDEDWDPNCIDCEGQLDNEEWFDAQENTEVTLNSPLFDEFGNCRNKTNVGEHEMCFFDADSAA